MTEREQVSVIWDSQEQSDAFMQGTLVPSLQIDGGFAGQPEERAAQVAQHDSIEPPTKPTRRTTMPSVIAYHEVDDQQHWLASANREEFFGPLGVTGIREFVDPENPSRVAVLMEIPDIDAVMAAVQTEDGAKAMADDGVRAETLVILVAAS